MNRVYRNPPIIEALCEFQFIPSQHTLEQLNALESITGILNELTPEQLEIFEEETERRQVSEL